jgi:hypothetical protein
LIHLLLLHQSIGKDCIFNFLVQQGSVNAEHTGRPGLVVAAGFQSVLNGVDFGPVLRFTD